MKNIFNKFAFFIALSFVFISCGNLTTSENDDSIPQGKGKITISTDLQNDRSVLPTEIKEDTEGLKWELVGIKDGTQQIIESWTDGTDETGTVTVTAYKSMTSNSGIVIDTGTWDFTLTASNTDGKNVLSATISTTINAGENKLNFVMQEATENAASGSIEFTLNFPKGVVDNVEATLYKYDNANNVVDTNRQLTIDNSSNNNFDSVKYSYPDATGTTSTDLSAGYYILKIELQQKKVDTTTPTVESKTINTYSCLVRVAPGLTSQGEDTLDKLAQLYTITYQCGQGSIGNQLTPTSYNAYTSFELPEPTLDGHYFAGWYTDSELTNRVELDENGKYRITQDTTLYAKWKISWDGLKNQIENDSGISEFVITEDLTATSTITVSKPFKITSDKNVTITRGNTTGNTSFTDAFFKVESAGNLELEGKENSTITLDGGKANESPILATAPLITSSGNLTLTNCTLQNNKNTSTTPGGAIYISAGKFTMNGGIIGKKITGSDASTEKQSWQDAATDSDFSNYAYAGGGGIYVEDGTVTIKDAKVSYNYVSDDDKNGNPDRTSLSSGGGICMNKGTLILENTEVSYNRGYLGGGVRCYNDGTVKVGTLTLKNATIKGNAGKHYGWSNFGGALAIRNFDVICDKSAEASIIEENYSADGGAVFLEYTTSTLENITIQNNSFNDNGYKYGSEMLLWENANISIASKTVNISSDNTTERKGIFINRSTDKLNLSGDISLNSPINLHFESGQSSPSTVTVAGNLSENNVATIYLVGNYTEGTQVLVAKDGVNLSEQVGKFTLKNTDYKISDDGSVAQNSGGGGRIEIASWDDLVSSIEVLTDDSITTEFIITDNLVATSKIETLVPVKITSSKAITITRDENFKELFFDTYASLEVVGSENAIITFDGNNIAAENSIIKINANLSLTYCNLQNNSNGASLGGGGAIYISESATSTFLKNCSIINNKAYSGGGIYYGNNGYNNYIENCTFENNSVTSTSGTGAGVMLHSGNLYIKSISMNSNYLADNETSADLYLYNAKQPEVVLDDVVSIQSLWFYFSSIFPILKVGSNLSGDVKVVLKPSSSSYSVNQLITLDSETVLSNTQIGCFSEIKDASNNYYTLLANGVINKN